MLMVRSRTAAVNTAIVGARSRTAEADVSRRGGRVPVLVDFHLWWRLGFCEGLGSTVGGETG